MAVWVHDVLTFIARRTQTLVSAGKPLPIAQAMATAEASAPPGYASGPSQNAPSWYGPHALCPADDCDCAISLAMQKRDRKRARRLELSARVSA
jgi:hypothetical protein